MSWKYQKEGKHQAKAPAHGMKICVKQPQLLEPLHPELGPQYQGWDNPELCLYTCTGGVPKLTPLDPKKKAHKPFYPLVWFEFND